MPSGGGLSNLNVFSNLILDTFLPILHAKPSSPTKLFNIRKTVYWNLSVLWVYHSTFLNLYRLMHIKKFSHSNDKNIKFLGKLEIIHQSFSSKKEEEEEERQKRKRKEELQILQRKNTFTQLLWGSHEPEHYPTTYHIPEDESSLLIKKDNFPDQGGLQLRPLYSTNGKLSLMGFNSLQKRKLTYLLKSDKILTWSTLKPKITHSNRTEL